MKKITKKWTLFLMATFVTFFGICHTLVKNTRALDEMPVNEAFDDVNFYKCVVDAYNKEKETDVDYTTTSLTDLQLSEITT